VPVTLTETDVASVTEVLRRVFARRVFDQDRLDDLVQDTLTRIVRARPGLDGEELVAYAVVVARNVLVSDARRRREVPEWVAGTSPADDPQEMAIRSEERVALREALAALPEADRRALLEHEVEGRTTADLAGRAGTSPGSIAARLARARARARVDYVIALRNASLPTDRCKPVLVSLSSGIKRRQQELSAADHLLTCDACADLAPPVIERKRSLAALVPVAGLPALLGHVRRFLGEHPVVSGAAAAGAAAGIAAVLLATSGGDEPRPSAAGRADEVATTVATTTSAAPSAAPTAACELLDPGGAPVALGPAGPAGVPVGSQLSMRGATVSAIPADEGFWADCSGSTIWVELTGSTESPAEVTIGARVEATGTVTSHGDGYAAAVGVTPDEGAADLDAAGVHLDVPQDALTVQG
jgi:RNA polymerase sigma factor (sigma-70 family)